MIDTLKAERGRPPTRPASFRLSQEAWNGLDELSEFEQRAKTTILARLINEALDKQRKITQKVKKP